MAAPIPNKLARFLFIAIDRQAGVWTAIAPPTDVFAELETQAKTTRNRHYRKTTRDLYLAEGAQKVYGNEQALCAAMFEFEQPNPPNKRQDKA